jgi:hypothetical protein
MRKKVEATLIFLFSLIIGNCLLILIDFIGKSHGILGHSLLEYIGLNAVFLFLAAVAGFITFKIAK